MSEGVFHGPLPQEGNCATCGKPFHVTRRPCCCASETHDITREGKWVAKTFTDGHCAQCCRHVGSDDRLAAVNAQFAGKTLADCKAKFASLQTFSREPRLPKIDAVGGPGCKASTETR